MQGKGQKVLLIQRSRSFPAQDKILSLSCDFMRIFTYSTKVINQVLGSQVHQLKAQVHHVGEGGCRHPPSETPEVLDCVPISCSFAKTVYLSQSRALVRVAHLLIALALCMFKQCQVRLDP